MDDNYSRFRQVVNRIDSFFFLFFVFLIQDDNRVQKRVTLMVIVTVIFGIFYELISVIYVLRKFTSYMVLVFVSFMMVLCNSAVNPFVYALLNRQFREKI